MALWMLAACLVAPLTAQPAELLQPSGRGAAPAPLEGEVTPASSREEKFLSVFQIVKFKNGDCPALNGDTGVCFTEAECGTKGGVSGGSCASGFGVCCVFTVSECGATVTENHTYIQSPDYPAAAPTGMCMYSINKCDAGICQFRIEFEQVEMGGPEMGNCNNDTLMVTGVDAVSMKVVPVNLCGDLSGQHMIVSVKDQTAPGAKIVFNHISGTARWRLRVIQIPCDSECGVLAPPGCLTYNTGESGTIASYNGQGATPELINDQKFSHCIKYQDGYCDVALTSNSFDLDTTGDSLTFGSNGQFGASFGTAGTLTWNFTGPYVITSSSNDDNTAMLTGYEISYLLLPC